MSIAYIGSILMEKIKNKECLGCGKELVGKQRKYCSKQCYKKDNRDKDKIYREKNKDKAKKYRDKNKERDRLTLKIWYQKNKDKVKLYQEKHRGKIKKNAKIYQKKNKEKIAEKKKIYCSVNVDKLKKKKQEYQDKNRTKISSQTKTYREKNKKILAEKRKVYRKNNKDKIRATQRKCRKERLKKDPMFRLNHNISGYIRLSLKNRGLSKKRKHWEDIVGYTVYELKEHLEKQFKSGMTWDNREEWQIDHIIPISFFEFRSMEDVEFRYCWSLDNLQPLWSSENLRKHNTIIMASKKESDTTTITSAT